VFAVATLAIGAWAFAVPLLTGPDEEAHVVRAAGVVRGDIVGAKLPIGDNAWVVVRAPAGYAAAGRASVCFVGDPYEPIFGSHRARADVDSCPRVVGLHGVESLPTYQHRGQPLLYALVGLPSRWFPGENGLYMMRAITTMLGAAFLASAWMSVRRLPDPRVASVALAAAITPSVLYFSGVVNPVGLEMAAALSAWAAGLVLAVSPDPPSRRLVARAGLALAVLTVTRGLGPLFAAVVVSVCVLLADPDRRRALARRGDVRVWGAVIAGCLAATAAWLVHLQRAYPLPAREGTGLTEALGRLPWFGRGLVGVFGPTDVVPPAVLHVAWGAVVVAILVVAARRGPRRDVAMAVGLLLGAAALLVSGEGWSIPQTGYWWQGRYAFPLFAGAVLVAGAAAGRRRGSTGPVLPDPARAGLITVLAVAHVWAFAYALRHYVVGYDGTLDPVDVLFRGYWSPVVGSAWLWAACLVAGVAGLALTAWRPGPSIPQGEGAEDGADGTDGDDLPRNEQVHPERHGARPLEIAP
jgi:hypothetical protein